MFRNVLVIAFLFVGGAAGWLACAPPAKKAGCEAGHEACGGGCCPSGTLCCPGSGKCCNSSYPLHCSSNSTCYSSVPSCSYEICH